MSRIAGTASTPEQDRVWMRRALALAREGWGQTAPNPLVGAVVVAGSGELAGEGFHARYGAPHAEAMALAAAGDRARGATVYVTLEPCAHHGKTPPCADALLAAGVQRVVVATADPNPVARGGLARLVAAGIETTLGVEEQEARDLNAGFLFAAAGARRPWVTLKLALDADGAMAPADGRQQWITGAESLRLVHALRAEHDAVAVGRATVVADDPALTVRETAAPRVPPLRVVFDRQGRLSLESHLVRTVTEVPVIIAATTVTPERRAVLEAAGVRIAVGTGLEAQLEQLRTPWEIKRLLVEAGPTLATALWEAKLVDRLIIFQGPVHLGPGARRPFGGGRPYEGARVVAERRVGDDRMTEYAIHDP